MAAVALTTFAVASTLIGCSSGNSSSTGTSAVGGAAVGQAVNDDSLLASALDLIPDTHNANVMFTDWSMLGHSGSNAPNTASFAGALLDVDPQLERNFGFRSTDAQWELDVDPPGRAPLIVLGFGPHTDLSDVESKLVHVGFHADGSLFTGSRDTEKLLAYRLWNVGIDARRHLLVESADTAAIKSVLTAPAQSLGADSEIAPLLSLASAKLTHVATAAFAVGPMACVQLVRLIRVPTPAELAAVRKQFHGTFTPPRAEMTALAGPASTSALDALTFPDQPTAQANEAGRSAASKVISGMMFGGATNLTVTSTAVTDRVLSFNLTATQPDDFPQLVDSNGLGVDVCP